MAINFRRLIEGLQIVPKTSSTVNLPGEMDFDTTSDKLNLHNGTSSSHVVTETHASQGADRLQNKDLDASNNNVVDPTDTTKQLGFQVSGATTGTKTTLSASQTANRTVTLPDASDTLISRSSTDTGTNRVKNKDLEDATTNIVDETDPSKKLNVQLSGATASTTTTLVANQSANRSLTLPDLSDTLVSRVSVDQGANRLKNKDLENSTTSFVDPSDITKQIKLDSSANSTGAVTTIATSSTVSETITLPSASGSILTRTSVDQGSGRLQNKDLDDESVVFVDNGDTSKKLGFQLGAATTSTKTTIVANQSANRSLTLPDLTDSLLSRSSTDTGANRLKNKDLEDSSTNIVDESDPTKKLNVQLTGAATATTTTLISSQSSNRSLTLPDATTTLVGTDTTQVLTNKDIDGGTASNTSRFTIPKDTKSNLDSLTRKEATLVYATDQEKAYIDNGSILVPVGSGDGSSGINFVGTDSSFQPLNSTDIDAEVSVGNWAAYANTPGVAPVDMTGGSPTITITRTTTSGEVLNGVGSFELTKDAANRQGEGVSCVANIPLGYRGLPGLLTLPYRVTSGSISLGDVKAYVYDVTNTALLTILNNNLTGSSGFLQAQWTPSSTTTQIRVGLHIASTTTTAFTISFDDVTATNTTVNSSVGTSSVRLNNDNGYGSTNIYVSRFATIVTNVGSAITITQSATDGDSFTINETGVYTACLTFRGSTSGDAWGVTKNFTGDIDALGGADPLLVTYTNVPAGTRVAASSSCLPLDSGDVLRVAKAASNAGVINGEFKIEITRVN